MRRIGRLQSITRKALFRFKKNKSKHNANASYLAYHSQTPKREIQNLVNHAIFI